MSHATVTCHMRSHVTHNGHMSHRLNDATVQLFFHAPQVQPLTLQPQTPNITTANP